MSELQGLKIKDYLEPLDISPEILLIKDEIKHFDNDNSFYIDSFEELKVKKVFNNKLYFDEKWIITTPLEKKNSTIDFTKAKTPYIKDLLRKYLITKLKLQNVVVRTAYTAVKENIDFLILSNDLSEENFIDIRDSLLFWPDYRKRNICYVKEFLRFTDIENSVLYYNMLDKIPAPRSRTRQLPSYQSIITFDCLIENFIIIATDKQLYKYYPILLWWQITKIIPMRPLEFFILRRDCLLKKTKKNRILYYIKINRVKAKNGKVKYKTLPILNEIEISKETYDFIQEYVSYANSVDNNEYLFSYEVHKKHFTKINNTTRDFIGSSVLRYLYQLFCKEIIEEFYGYNLIKKNSKKVLNNDDLEKIQYGDTRHIAFCSMMLQGLNPLSIAQIGGHHTLSVQMGYFNHLDDYITAKTYVLAKALKNKLYLRQESLSLAKNFKNMLITKDLMGSGYYKLPKNKHGRCISKNFPYECTFEDCILCDKSIPDNDISQELLDEQEKRISNELELKLIYLKKMISNNSDLIQNEIDSISKNINTLINQRTLIKAYKLNKEDNNECWKKTEV